MATADGPTNRRPPRRRALLAGGSDTSDGELDAMLEQLGIPASRPRRQEAQNSRQEQREGEAEAETDIIELITPPRSAASVEAAVQQREDRRASIVDLTLTPSPSAASGAAAAPRIVAVESAVTVVDLESEDSDIDAELASGLSTGLRTVVARTQQSTSSLEFTMPSIEEVATETSSQTALTTPQKKRRRAQADAPTPSRSPAAASPAGKRRGDDQTPSKEPAPTLLSPHRRGARSGAVTPSIFVRMELSLDSSEAGATIRQALRAHVYNGKPIPLEIRPAFTCKYQRVVLWDRGAETSGALDAANSSPCACAIYLDGVAFINLLLEQTYTGLISIASHVKTLMRGGSSQESQVFFVVEKVDQALVAYKREARNAIKAGRNPPDFAFADLNEVAFQLFMDVGAHTKFTCDLDASASYLAMLTREMVLSTTRKSPEEEFLESIPRLHSFRVTASGVTTSSFANAWLRMLQTIPGVSEDKAQCLMDSFPTFESLMRAYNDPSLSQSDKEYLLCDKLHDARIERALSRRIYTIFCSTDPTLSIP